VGWAESGGIATNRKLELRLLNQQLEMQIEHKKPRPELGSLGAARNWIDPQIEGQRRI